MNVKDNSIQKESLPFKTEKEGGKIYKKNAIYQCKSLSLRIT